MYDHIVILLSMSSLLMKSVFSYKHCETQTCNGLTIKHPFWIPGLQEPECGSTGFNVTCHEKQALIQINGAGFIIRDIFYKNATFLLAQWSVLEWDAACVAPQRNFSVEGTPFAYGPATTDLFFLYNCTTPFDRETYDVGCASNATGRYSFAVFHLQLLHHWNYSAQSCRPPVNAAVEADDLARLLNITYAQLLNNGFVLQWHCDACHTGRRLKFGLKIGIGIGAAAVSTLIMCVILSLYHHRYKKHQATSYQPPSSYPYMSEDLEKAGVDIFDYKELEEATDHFNPKRELGDGGYGAVFKGKLKDGRDVAVKRLYEHHYRRMEQFKNEVEIVRRLRHKNLVSLYGCTTCHSRELLLVYEYIPGGTLGDHLHGQRAEESSCTLPWRWRLSIAIETASALAYLHSLHIVHRDVKTSNILIDNCFRAKLADFGLSRQFPTDATHVSTGPQGTPGYVDPQYNQFYQLTQKSDVYSFGVVLIELISSKPAIDLSRNPDEINLSTMAIKKIQDQAVVDLVDPLLGFQSDDKVTSMILAVAELAFRCLQIGRELRPCMQDVVNVLKEIQTTDALDIPADYAQILLEDD